MSASKEILRPINKIKTSINENDQLLWQCQSSTKCYTTATERLIEKCENIRKEIRKLEEEILEMDPQTDILASCYQVQLENLTLNQESLVIQKLHKKCIENSIKKHKDDAHQATEEYSQHIKKCKEKLEIGNPIYKSLQAKKVELLKSKIGCMELTKKISKAKGLNKEKK
ncbi:hypothetical protein NQ317_019812 [Molorchus minor]|uniref:Uncharacterized protein n=1 Tax=Molorchus minor TaxID=1323400 RepID=A0ABQ9J9C9_9CUCU|nr:hypothetical protein NQ317_019812 [Molorchus minor]